jgi:hypothetical protein
MSGVYFRTLTRVILLTCGIGTLPLLAHTRQAEEGRREEWQKLDQIFSAMGFDPERQWRTWGPATDSSPVAGPSDPRAACSLSTSTKEPLSRAYSGSAVDSSRLNRTVVDRLKRRAPVRRSRCGSWDSSAARAHCWRAPEMETDRRRTRPRQVAGRGHDMGVARLLVSIMAIGTLIPMVKMPGPQPPATAQLLWQFEAGG